MINNNANVNTLVYFVRKILFRGTESPVN